MEEWRDIKGSGGKYQVSSFGNVRKLCGPRSRRKDKYYKIIGPYPQVVIEGIVIAFPVHVLVATTFLPDLSKTHVIKPIDGDYSNSRLDNLEWVEPEIIEDLPGETWRNIEGYDGKYQISNKGNFRGITDYRGRLKGAYHRIKPLFPKGRKSVCLYDNRTKKYELRQISRLVAQSFLLNPENKREVNHIDEDPTNNCLENLEWVTRSENTRHGSCTRRGLETRAIRGRSCAEVPVKQICPKTNKVLRIYRSLSDARRKTGVSVTGLYNSCRRYEGKVIAGGYKWEHASTEEYHNRIREGSNEDKDSYRVLPPNRGKLPVEKINPSTGEVLGRYESCYSAAKAVSVHPGAITKCCKGNRGRVTAGGFKWRYAEDKGETNG